MVAPERPKFCIFNLCITRTFDKSYSNVQYDMFVQHDVFNIKYSKTSTLFKEVSEEGSDLHCTALALKTGLVISSLGLNAFT
jgi:hypothetical protein